MNVRFFAGTRAQYDSLPAPRNPLGLYFCADTQELFWADRLLTDGMRVVEKQTDLPAPEQAADGVVYYVNETRNGYVVPHGTNKWLQTIYAPLRKGESVVPGEEDNTVTTIGAVNDIVAQIYKDMEERIANIEVGALGSGVKVIEFAGYELEEVGDGNFTIDRRCARKALGFIVPDGLEDEEITIATKEYVDRQIAAITGADLGDFVKHEDLENYATKSFVEEKIAEIPGVDIDLSDYYTKAEVENLIPDISNFATKDEIPSVPTKISELENDAGYLTQHQDLSEYAKKSEIDELATAESVEALANTLENTNNQLDRVTRATEALQEAVGTLEIPTKVSELENDAGYLTEHQDLSEYAKKSELPSVEGLASEDFVRSEIAKAELNGGEVTEEELDNLLANYYNKTEIDNKISDYYTKEEVNEFISDVDELATKEALQTVATDVDALAVTTTKERYEVIRVPGLEVMHRDGEIRLNTEHVELAPQNVGDGGESNAYYVGIKIYAPANAESIRQNVTSTPGIQDGKEIVSFTTTDIDSYGRKYSTIWVKCAVYQNGAWLNYGMNSTSAKCLGYYYSVEWYDNNSNIIENDSIHVVFTNDTCHYSNISDAVSRRFITVEEAIAAINIPETDLSNYYNKSETETLVNEAVNGIKIPDTSNFITMEDVEGKGYLTEHQDLSDYAKKSDLPSIEGLASEDFVRSEIAKAELNGGEVTEEELDNLLANYYNKTEVDNKFKDLEIPSIEGLASEEFVNKAIAGIEIPEAEIYKVDFNAPNFAEATEAYKAGKVLVLINAAPDVNSYALMNYASDSYITFTKFLTSRSEAYGAFNTYYLSANNTWEVSKEVRLNKVEANVEGEVNDELTSIKIGKEIYKLPTVDLTGYATKDELATIEAKIPTDYLKEIPSEYITETRLNEVLADIEHPSVDLSGYATTESVEALAADIEHDRAQLESIARATESTRAEVATLSATTVTQKYEVLPIEGMLIQYRDGEIRLNTQRVVPSLQQVGATGNPNMYYATFRAFAPEGATQCKEGLNGAMDAGYSELSTDAYGRKYATIWAAIANTVDGGATWSKWGNTSTLDKYLGFYYHFEWYKGDVLIGKDKVRVILTNDACHDDLVPDAVARRIDEKVATVNTVVNNITEQIQNIESTYVTNNYITENYTTKEELANNYVTNEQVTEVVTNEVTTVVTEQIETKVTEVVQEKVDSGEIIITKVDTIKYDTWEVD